MDALQIEEYEFCRQLIIENISVIEKTEIYAVGAVAATIAFSASQSNPLLAFLSSLLPLIISIIGFTRFFGMDKTIGRINSYLITLEEKQPNIKWTEYYRHSKPRALKLSRWWIWGILG
jgi:hypothetical protein